MCMYHQFNVSLLIFSFFHSTLTWWIRNRSISSLMSLSLIIITNIHTSTSNTLIGPSLTGVMQYAVRRTSISCEQCDIKRQHNSTLHIQHSSWSSFFFAPFFTQHFSPCVTLLRWRSTHCGTKFSAPSLLPHPPHSQLALWFVLFSSLLLLRTKMSRSAAIGCSNAVRGESFRFFFAH